MGNQGKKSSINGGLFWGKSSMNEGFLMGKT
jgi:hypothetical protein